MNLRAWWLRCAFGTGIVIAEDFDAPLADFAEYMPTEVCEHVIFRPYGKSYRTMSIPAIRRARRMCDRAFDRLIAEPETPERATKLCALERKRMALANSIGAC